MAEAGVTPRESGTRSLAVAVIAVAAGVFLLRYAWGIWLPVAMGIFVSYALDPIVAAAARLRIPRSIGAALVLALFTGAAVYGVYSLSDDALAIVESLPASAKKLRESWYELRGREGTVQTLTDAVTEIQKTAQPSPTAAPANPGITRVQVVQPFNISRYLWSGSMGVVGLLGQAITVVFLAYFLLAAGDLHRRKIVKIAGTTLASKRVTVEILNEISAQIGRFLFVQMITSALVAIVSALVFRWLGLERAVFWGLMAGLFNTIPYFGPLIVMGGIAAVAFLQFGTLEKTIALAIASLVVTSLEGFLLTPYLLGRHLRMNGAAIFIGLLFWGWVWGIWGLLLAAPMMVVVKSISDHVEDLKGVGDLLGD
ncbi:MAG TPA: AI-2E family transporter [Candidatus Polarisedimenticolaceae bacterium]|nr:AI-2E family transporter [Candidatus Polarisedimenticolaceae bacterium]